MTDLSRRSLLRGSLAAMMLAHPALARAASAALAGDVAQDWPGIARLMRRYVSEGKLPGMVATMGWGAAPPRVLTLGSHAFDAVQPVGIDSLYRIYSMTKPVTGLLAAMLITEGKLSLDTRLADVFPEFSAMRVAIDPAKGLESQAATVAITVRHLLTHTAGFGYGGIGRDKVSAELARNGLLAGVVSRKPIPSFTSPVPVPAPDEFIRRAANVPLVAEPGTVWRYSMALDVLGLMMARLTGKPLGQMMHERIFGPAGMTATRFRLCGEDRRRLTTNYGILGALPVPIDGPDDTIFTDRTAFEFGGAGLVSSPRDFDRFMQILLNGGKLGTRKVIDPAAVSLAVSNLLPAGVVTRGTFSEGAGYGAGGRVGLGADEGSFGWSGAAGTVFFIQRRIGLRGALYAQFMPPETYPLQREFLAAARDDVTPRTNKTAA